MKLFLQLRWYLKKNNLNYSNIYRSFTDKIFSNILAGIQWSFEPCRSAIWIDIILSKFGDDKKAEFIKLKLKVHWSCLKLTFSGNFTTIFVSDCSHSYNNKPKYLCEMNSLWFLQSTNVNAIVGNQKMDNNNKNYLQSYIWWLHWLEQCFSFYFCFQWCNVFS